MFPENIRSGNATASEYVHVLSESTGLILTGNIVKHEQKKKDKSAKLLKELESETQDAVGLARDVRRIPPLIKYYRSRGKPSRPKVSWMKCCYPPFFIPSRRTDLSQERTFSTIHAGLCRKRR